MARMRKYLSICLVVFLVVSILLSLDNALLFADANTIAPVVEYTIYEPSPDKTYTNTMMISFSYDVSYKDSGAKSLGRTNCYSIDGGANQSFPTGWYVKAADISKLSNGTHELSIYVWAPYVYNDAIFPNTFKLFSTNFTVLNLSPTPTQITNIPSQSPASTPSPTVPEFPIILSLVAVLAAVSLLLIVGKKKLNS
jgi:hypothetical protein